MLNCVELSRVVCNGLYGAVSMVWYEWYGTVRYGMVWMWYDYVHATMTDEF
jgi:hypothetical protein